MQIMQMSSKTKGFIKYCKGLSILLKVTLCYCTSAKPTVRMMRLYHGTLHFVTEQKIHMPKEKIR